jgi:hypothetical protein
LIIDGHVIGFAVDLEFHRIAVVAVRLDHVLDDGWILLGGFGQRGEEVAIAGIALVHIEIGGTAGVEQRRVDRLIGSRFIGADIAGADVHRGQIGSEEPLANQFIDLRHGRRRRQIAKRRRRAGAAMPIGVGRIAVDHIVEYLLVIGGRRIAAALAVVEIGAERLQALQLDRIHAAGRGVLQDRQQIIVGERAAGGHAGGFRFNRVVARQYDILAGRHRGELGGSELADLARR